AATLTVGVTAYGLQMNIPITVVNGIDVFSGPSFTVSGNFGLSDFISVEAIGTVDLNFGNFTANAAGVITAPPVTNTGNNPGQTVSDAWGMSSSVLVPLCLWGGLLLGRKNRWLASARVAQ